MYYILNSVIQIFISKILKRDFGFIVSKILIMHPQSSKPIRKGATMPKIVEIMMISSAVLLIFLFDIAMIFCFVKTIKDSMTKRKDKTSDEADN